MSRIITYFANKLFIILGVMLNAGTVREMSRNDNIQVVPLSETQLGDIVVLPDGRSLTARAKAVLPSLVGSMAGFVICGEMEVLLSIPPTVSAPINVYVPVEHLPASLTNSRTVFEGAVSYWAPHLPSATGAMAEILYRVVEVRGSVDPIVIVYRGAEVIVFIRTTFAYSSDIKVLYMPRSESNDYDVDRHAAIVDVPVSVPAPEKKRHLPERVKEKPRRRIRQR